MFVGHMVSTKEPLTKLLCKNTPFLWAVEQQLRFEKLKLILTQATPELGKEFVVYSDASNTGFGCVLMSEGKANVAVDTLSQRSMSNLRAIFSCLSLFNNGGILAELKVKPSWLDEIKSKQVLDESLISQVQQMNEDKTSDFRFNNNGILCFRGHICVLMIWT
ncbi:integrase [Gossypium australe]|uniref:Integrase n=1 Tax=Gossypium australe TaxID=47621 RepID=A0A5B6UZT3_9ROSI|nr:integrase [Gossypium australe]